MTIPSIKRFIYAAALILAGLQSALAADKDPQPVRTIPLEKTTISATINVFGELERTPETLYFETDGYLTRLAAREGEEIRKGQLLAELDNRDIEYRKSQAELDMLHAKDKLNKAQRLSDKLVLPRDTMEDREHDYALKKKTLSIEEDLYRKHFLRAPADGKILKRFIDFPGPVSASTPVFIMKSAHRPWRLSVDLSVSEAAQIRPGSDAEIEFDGLPDQNFSAKVEKISDSAESSDGMLEADLLLTEAAEQLRAGMKADVKIHAVAKRSGYLVPVNALLRIINNQGSLFLIAPDQKVVHFQQVEFDLLENGDALILNNLSSFAQAVVAGQHNLKDGDPVEVLK